MSSICEPTFKPPPTIECLVQNHCLGIGRKINNPSKVCHECLKRYDPQQLRTWANDNFPALSIINAQVLQKHEVKKNLEAHGRFLCAFEDPDYQHCRWREFDLNLRGTRLNCTTVRKKGKACDRCWKRHLQKIGIVQYFTPTGLCHEEADKIVTSPKGSGAGTEAVEDDVEGYNIIFE